MEKKENAGNQHFLHFPQCFLPRERHIPNSNDPEKAFEKNVGIGENSGYQYFSPFPTIFCPFLTKFEFFNHFHVLCANVFNLVLSKILLLNRVNIFYENYIIMRKMGLVEQNI